MEIVKGNFSYFLLTKNDFRSIFKKFTNKLER